MSVTEHVAVTREQDDRNPSDERDHGEPPLARPLAIAGRFRRIIGAVPTPLIFLIAIGVAVLILWRRGALGEVATTIRNANPVEIAAGASLYLLGLWLLCVRWHLLVRLIRGSSDLPRASEAFLTSVALNYIAPVSVAIPTRAALTKRALGLSTSQTGAVALWELIADVLVLAVGGLLWLLIAPASWGVLDTVPLPVVALGGTVAVVGTLVMLLIVIRHAGPRRRLGGAAKGMFTAPRQRPGVFATVLAVSVLFWVIQGGVLWLLLGALDTERHVQLILGITTLPWLVGMLSMVPGGTGVREGMMVAIARVEGVSGSAALVAAVTYRICLFAAIPVLYAVVRVWLARRGTPVPLGESSSGEASAHESSQSGPTT